MAKSWLPKVKVAACNVSPIYMNTRATLSKTLSLIREASRSGNADLVVFPETHIPGFPLWPALSAPIDNHSLFSLLASQSISINGPEIASIKQSCAENNIWCHVGFNERADGGRGEVSFEEAGADFLGEVGRGLKVVDGGDRVGRVGGLICGESTNPLARYSLMAQGEQLHISTWPAVWPTRRPAATSTKTTSAKDTPQPKQYNNLAANRTRTAAHCFEAKCFGVMCAGYMDKTMRDTIISHTPSAVETLDSLTQGESCFIDPTGAQVGESVQGEEGIAYATLDLNECVEPKQFHDVVGYYQRFDVFDLKVDRRARGVEGMFVDEERGTDGVDVEESATAERKNGTGRKGGEKT
ncbi:hypothetical protein Q7P36_003693 [Cladosporium allicinum]